MSTVPDDGLLEALKGGECALLATDTVYGIAALPSTSGYKRIFELKERPQTQVLPWLVGGVDALSRYGTDLQPYVLRLTQRFWPGGLTFVVKASPEALALGCTAQDGTVALRCPDDKACLRLLHALDAPLACTSANVHGRPAPTSLSQVEERFLRLPHDKRIASSCPRAMSSTIVDCTGAKPLIIRQGAIPAERLIPA